MLKCEEAISKEDGTMFIDFSIPLDLLEDAIMVLLDLGWIKSPEQVTLPNEKADGYHPIPLDLERFWESYNDPDRPRITKEKMLGQLMSEPNEAG